jgi:hypothetical protein
MLPAKLSPIEETAPKPADLLVIKQGPTGVLRHICFFERWSRWRSRTPRVIELSGASGGGRVYNGPLSNPFPASEVFVADFDCVVERLRRRQKK